MGRGTVFIYIVFVWAAVICDIKRFRCSSYSVQSYGKGLRSIRMTSTTSHGNIDPTIVRRPKLIVFDLDNTLWTPELYTLRRIEGTGKIPIANKDIKLFPGAQEILLQIQEGKFPNIQFAIASRTKSIKWANDLLNQFNIRNLFSYVEIFPADKKQHFTKLRSASSIDFQDMLFFDDARDGKFGNCMSVAELGVLSVHCPCGLQSIDLFQTALLRYQHEWDGTVGTIIENDGTITYPKRFTVTNQSQNGNQRHKGQVKFMTHDKRYGFIQYDDQSADDIFFHRSSLPQQMINEIQQGTSVSFTVRMDQTKNKPIAQDVEIISSPSEITTTDPKVTETLEKSKLTTLPAFSMNMPFAALVANRYKTLESRNGTMFLQYPEDRIMLLHVGQRTYPDGNKHIDIMKCSGLSDNEIDQFKKLPDGYQRGMIIAICQLGKTIEMSCAERSVPRIEQRIVAYGQDSGKMVTEIKQIQYLLRPVITPGQSGIFNVDVPIHSIPNDFIKINQSIETRANVQKFCIKLCASSEKESI
jgi:magnesium-dependent phosphatase 1